MKKLYIILLLLLLFGCMYDPPLRGKKTLFFYNCTDSAIYYHMSCIDSLTLDCPLFLFNTFKSNSFAYKGKFLEGEVYTPWYRINAYSDRGTGIRANESLANDCIDRKLRIFFIKESTLMKYSWKEICERQMYAKKLILKAEDLQQCDWCIVYE